MKTKKIMFNLVIIVGLITPFFFVVTPVTSQDSDFETRKTIQISEGTNISVTAAAPLRWTLGELTNLTVNIRLLALDDTYLNIILLSAAYNIPDEPFPISQPQQSIETRLNNSFNNVTNIQSLTAPENTDDVPSFDSPGRAVRAIGMLTQYAEYLKKNGAFPSKK